MFTSVDKKNKSLTFSALWYSSKFFSFFFSAQFSSRGVFFCDFVLQLDNGETEVACYHDLHDLQIQIDSNLTEVTDILNYLMFQGIIVQVHHWHATVLAAVVNRMKKESLAISKLNNVALHFFFIDAFLETFSGNLITHLLVFICIIVFHNFKHL